MSIAGPKWAGTSSSESTVAEPVIETIRSVSWPLVWSVLAVVCSWTILYHREKRIRERRIVYEDGSQAVLHLINFLGLVAATVALRRSLLVEEENSYEILVRMVIVATVFFQWMVSWLALRSYSRPILSASLVTLEGLISTGILGIILAIFVRFFQTPSEERASIAPMALILLVVMSAVLAGHWKGEGIFASWSTDLLPGLMIILWMFLLYVVNALRTPTDLLPPAIPSTRFLRAFLVLGVPAIALSAVAAGAGVAFAKLPKRKRTRTRMELHLRIGTSLLVAGALGTIALATLAAVHFRSLRDILRWIWYGVRAQSVFL